MLIRPSPTILLQIFCKIIVNSKDMFQKNHISRRQLLDKLWSIIFDGEILIRTSPTTLFQIFCKIIANSKDMFKKIIDSDDNW